MASGIRIGISIATISALALSLYLVRQRNITEDEAERYPKHYLDAQDCLVIERATGAQAHINNICDREVTFEYVTSPGESSRKDRLDYGPLLTLPSTVQVVRACFEPPSSGECSISGPYESDTPNPPDLRLSQNQIHTRYPATADAPDSATADDPDSAADEEDEAHHPTIAALAENEKLSLDLGSISWPRACQFIANHHPLIEAHSPDALAMQCYCEEKGDLGAAEKCSASHLPSDTATHCADHPSWCFGRANPTSVQFFVTMKALQMMGIDTHAVAEKLDQARNRAKNLAEEAAELPRKISQGVTAAEHKVEDAAHRAFGRPRAAPDGSVNTSARSNRDPRGN